MADFKNGRKIVSVTMTDTLYNQLVAHCKDVDLPLSVFCRQLIQREVQKSG